MRIINIHMLRKNYSQVILSPENILLSFNEEWRGRNRLDFLLNQGLALNFPYIVRDICPDPIAKIILGINTRNKKGDCREVDYFYAGFFDLINPLRCECRKTYLEQLEFLFQEQLKLAL